MKRLIPFLFLLTSWGFAQGTLARYENVVLSKDAQGFVKPLTVATITVCKEPASGTTSLCSPITTIYDDPFGASPKSNPFNVDSAGGFVFYAPQAQYRIQINALGTISTMTNVDLSNPTTPLGLYRTVAFGTAMNFDASLGGIFAVTLTGNVTSSTIASSVAGNTIGFQVCQDATGGRTFAWPGSFVDPPTVTNTANGCTSAFFYYDGSSWRGLGGVGGGGGGGTGGLIIVNSNAGLPSTTNGTLYIAGGFGGTVQGRNFIGDGTGFSYFLSKRTGGATTDLFGFKDDGSMSLLGTGNGVWDMASSAAGVVGPANFIRWTGNSNEAAVSENGGTVKTLSKKVDDRFMWSDSHTNTTMSGTFTLSQTQASRAIVITRFVVFLNTVPVGCATAGVLTLENTTAAQTVATVTLVNGTAFYIQDTITNSSIAANNTMSVKLTTAQAGCSTNGANPHFTALYRMQ